MPISQTEGYIEIPYYHFSEEPMLFMLTTSKTTLSLLLRQKATQILPLRVADRSNHS